MASDSLELLNIDEGDGFGIGGFGGIDEPFGGIGFLVQVPPIIPAIFPADRTGAVILGRKNSVYVSQNGIVDIGRTDHIDSTSINCKSNRNLIFES